MSRTVSIILRALLALMILAGVIGAGAWAYRAGYTQGYYAGSAVTDGDKSDGSSLVPGLPFGPGWMMHTRPFYMFSPFRMIGTFFCGGLLFIAVLAFIFRPRYWHHHAHWAERGPWGTPPWAHEPEHAPEQKPDADKPAS